MNKYMSLRRTCFSQRHSTEHNLGQRLAIDAVGWSCFVARSLRNHG